MLTSLVDSTRCATVKKRVYMPRVADEYNSSSQPLNAVVLASILSMVSPPYNSNKKLRQGYIVDLAREGGVSPCALMLGLLYIKRLSNTNPDYVRLISPRDLFLVSMVVASKYMNDEGEMEALTNSDWAKLGCMTKTTLDELERNFLRAIDWKLYVSLEEYYTFVNSIEARIALDQATRRGWFTYTDLNALWDATEIPSSMMFATRQTAKVATKGAALYLMCVATLFAASGTLPLTQDLSLQLSTSSGAIGQSSHAQEAANYLGHAHAPPTAQQRMYYDRHSIPNFDAMDTVHRKKKSSNRLDLSQIGIISSARSDKIMHHDYVVSMSGSNVASTSHSSFMLVGGSGEESVHSSGNFDLKTGTDQHSDSSLSGGSIDKETLLPGNTNSSDKKRRTDNTWSTWSKFEDRILLLLNLVASITMSSAAKHGCSNSSSGSVPPPSPSHTPPPGNPASPTTTATSKQSYNYDIHGVPMFDNAMGSETATLSASSSAVPSKHPSCRDYQRNVLWNVAAHWWDGRKPQACIVDETSKFLTSPHNPRVAPRRKRNATVHYSNHEAVSMDTLYSGYETVTMDTSTRYGAVTTDTYTRYGAVTMDAASNRCMCATPHSVMLGPVLSTGHVAVDLNWQGGGTGDQSITSREFFNHSATTLSGDWKNFTLTENLLLYANSLLTMAF